MIDENINVNRYSHCFKKLIYDLLFIRSKMAAKKKAAKSAKKGEKSKSKK